MSVLSYVDLLRTQSVPQLRQLIDELDSDATKKKSELQLMVGSKYHDFIQSADSIGEMCNKAAEMQAKLGTFLSASQTLVSHTEKMLNSTETHDIQTTLPSSDASPRFLFEVLPCPIISAGMVWTHLENCEIAQAALIVLLSISSSQQNSEHFDQEVYSCLLRMRSTFSNSLKGLLEKVEIPNIVRSQLQDITFLYQTVCKDAHLFLMLNNVSTSELSTNLAAMRALGGYSLNQLLVCLLTARNAHLDHFCRRDQRTSSLKGSLTEFVRIFQKTIIDVYLLFMKTTDSSMVAGVVELASNAFDRSMQSLLHVFLSRYSSEANETIYTSVKPTTAAIPKVIDEQSLRACFDDWLTSAISRGVDLTSRNLGSMDSANAVSSLQQQVWHLSTHFDTESLSKSNEGYNQSSWEAASAELLVSLRRRKSETVIPAGQLLWANALRQPFLQHVEHLLRDSCVNVLDKFRSQLVMSLQQLGLAINENTLIIVNDDMNDTVNASNTTSPIIFSQANILIQIFEGEMDLLLGGRIRHNGINDHDPHASAALERALYVQCAHLAGQLSILLRTVNESLRTVLKTCIVSDDVRDSCQYGLLLVGRLTWMMYSRSGILEQCLDENQVSNNNILLSTRGFPKTSDEQLRSAFEIADANGDGKLCAAEAVDAIQALAIDTDELPFLSSRLTPSVTFAELELLCTHLLHNCEPARKFGQCLESISQDSHVYWGEEIVRRLSIELNLSLQKEMKPSSISAKFLALWKLHEIDLDADQNEKIMLPSSPSPALFEFIRKLNKSISSSILSIDTVQLWTRVCVDNVSQERRKEGKRLCLASLVMEKLLTISAHSLTSVYTDLEKAFARSKDAVAEEKSILQALMDISVIQKVFGRGCKAAFEKMKVSCHSWESHLDPVNAHLMLPILEKLSEASIRQSFLVFSGYGDLLRSLTKQKQTEVVVDEVGGIRNGDSLHNDTEILFRGVFCTSQIPRFSLLPLAVTASPQVWKGSTGRKQEKQHQLAAGHRQKQQQPQQQQQRQQQQNYHMNYNATSDGFGKGLMNSFFGK